MSAPNNLPVAVSALGPVDPASLNHESDEKEKSAPWIIRKLVGVSAIYFVPSRHSCTGNRKSPNW